MSEISKVQDGQVVSMDYSLHVDGELIDTSDGNEPLEFLQGAGNIIPGLERELLGMAIGDSKKVVVQPGDGGYGDIDPEAFIEVERSAFPEGFPLEPGIELQVHDEEGNPMHATVESIRDESVRLNFNHPLAGKELHFDVTIVALREATEEEMEHGHVHGDDYDDEEYDEDFEDFEDEEEDEA